MGNEVSKIEDGFDTFQDEIEGDEEQRFSAIKGRRLKFSNDFIWMDGKAPLPKNTRLVAIDVKRVELKWPTDNSAPQSRELKPYEKFRNTETLNEKTPRKEWRKGPNGKMEGPWANQHVVHFIDRVTMDVYSYPTSTDGGSIAVRELTDRIKLKRRFCGAGACPVVEFADVFMNTQFGGRQRPYFNIVEWVSLSSGELTSTETPAIEGPKAEQPKAKPSSAEDNDDDIKL